ncbi:MAG: hypothetical protein JWP58_2075 [Hymenobacter sp.]|nr:hypothetical protein [Hymenobacter sp.]
MRQYHRTVFFTKSPLSGYYKYQDVFQIFPAELENMPAFSSERQFHFPNILEYWTSDEELVTLPPGLEGLEELHTIAARRERKEEQILGLLTSFSNNLFFKYAAADASWGFPMPPDSLGEEINARASVWCWRMYTFPDLSRQLTIEGFTECSGHGISTLPYNRFYTHYPNLDTDRDEPLILPSAMDRLLRAYYTLDSATRDIIDYAISFTVSAVKLHYTDKTVSLLASFTSLETLVDLEYRGQTVENCPTCGQPRHKVSAKFRGFLMKYIGESPANKKKFNAYYSLRSSVVHTGRQLATEKLFAEVSEDDAQRELVDRTEILQLGKLAITRWLLATLNVTENH